MALQLKLQELGINYNGTEMYLADSTGDHSSTNTGGWETPNPSRVTKALLVQCFLRKTETSNEIFFSPYDPETVVNFTLLCTEDGYHDVFMIAVDKVVPTIEGNYGWTVGSGLVKLVDGELVSKTVEDAYLDPTFFDAVNYKTVLLARTVIYKNDKLLQLIEKQKAAANDKGHNREISDMSKNFDYVRNLLEGARLHGCSQRYTEAQTIVETINTIQNDDV